MENTLSMTQLACHRKVYCTLVCLALLISTRIHIFLSLWAIFYHIAKQIMLNRLIWCIWISGAVHKALSHTRAPKRSLHFQHFDFVYPNGFPLKSLGLCACAWCSVWLHYRMWSWKILRRPWEMCLTNRHFKSVTSICCAKLYLIRHTEKRET